MIATIVKMVPQIFCHGPYDAIGQVASVVQAGNGFGRRADLTYRLGLLESVTRYADVTDQTLVAESTYKYDNKGQLRELEHENGGTQLRIPYRWGYDSVGLVRAQGSIDGVVTYAYDGFAQLKSSAYTYDANGNRVGGGRVTGPGNRLKSDGRFGYQYDGEGNLIRKTDTPTGEVTTYAWDHRNRLTSVRVNGNVTAEYKYDAFDRRIYARATSAEGQQSVEWLAYDGDNIILAFDGDRRVTHRYLHGPATDMVLADEQVSYPEGGGATARVVWVLSDNLGTVRDLVDSSGRRLNHYRYDPFGNVQADNQEVTTRYGFTGREYDANTGLHYYRARYYDSNTGRFLSEDPAEQGSNFYTYVSNSPTMGTDPSGMVHGWLAAGIGAVVGVATYVIGAGITSLLTGENQFSTGGFLGAAAGGAAVGFLLGAATGDLTSLGGLALAGAKAGFVGGGFAGLVGSTTDEAIHAYRNDTTMDWGKVAYATALGAASGAVGGAVGGAAFGIAGQNLAGAIFAGQSGGAASGMFAGGVDAWWNGTSVQKGIFLGWLVGAASGGAAGPLAYGGGKLYGKIVRNSLIQKASAARDESLNQIYNLAPKDLKDRSVVVGGVNRHTGETAVGIKRSSIPEHYGKCAEDLCVESLGCRPEDVLFSRPIRPRTNSPVNVCKRCQTKYTRDQFAPGTGFED